MITIREAYMILHPQTSEAVYVLHQRGKEKHDIYLPSGFDDYHDYHIAKIVAREGAKRFNLHFTEKDVERVWNGG